MLKNIIILVFMLFMLIACDNSSTEQEAPKKSVKPLDDSTLTFVTINSPNTYFVNSDNEFAGLEYDLAKAFARYLDDGRTVKFIVADTVEDVLATIINKEAHIAAADLTVTEERKSLVDFSKPYEDVQQQVIYNRKKTNRPARKISDITKSEIVVPEATSFAERLEKLAQKDPNIQWKTDDSVHSEDLLESLADGEIDYTVADNHLVYLMQNFYPDLGIAFRLGKPEKIAWAVSKQSNPEILEKINAFFSKIKKDGTLNNIIDRYYGNSKRLNRLDVTAFISRKHKVLPKYTRLFQQAQEITGLDWRLLAAVGYRESHWNTYATSPTGVRGLMMLTHATADRMRVTDRLDPKQSIPAGAKYINIMINSLPERIVEPDRTFMALAAYNIGMGHVEDARVLAQRLGRNPDRWADLKKTLPLLTKPKYYKTLKHGYARGGAPVIYVEEIRSFYKILTKYLEPYQPDIDNPYKIASSGAVLN